MTTTSDYLKRAAERTGYQREAYIERNMPTSPSNVVALAWYGDMASTAIFSSLILKTWMKNHSDKYLILCSWPGYQDLFPYVHEFWSIPDESVSKTLALGANNFYNESQMYVSLTRSLIEVMNVMTIKDFGAYYKNGFTRQYWDEFKSMMRFLPEVPSDSMLNRNFAAKLDYNKNNVLLYPTTKLRSWQRGQQVYLPVGKPFWIALTDRLLEAGYHPVLYQNWNTYDLSPDYLDRCLYLVPRNMRDVLAAMHAIGMVLDVYSGISKLAALARTPFVCVDERARFVESQDYAFDDLCCQTQRQYLFSFATMLMAGGVDDWKNSILDNIVARINKSYLDKESRAATNESYVEVSYDAVRERKIRNLGLRFISQERQTAKCSH